MLVGILVLSVLKLSLGQKCGVIFVPGVFDSGGCEEICSNSRACSCFSFNTASKDCFLKQVTPESSCLNNLDCRTPDKDFISGCNNGGMHYVWEDTNLIEFEIQKENNYQLTYVTEVAQAAQCQTICNNSETCKCFSLHSFIDDGGRSTATCYLKNETFRDSNGNPNDPNNLLPGVSVEQDESYTSGCGDKIYNSLNIANNDVLCLETDNDKISWQKKVLQYANWMFNHGVALDEMVHWVRKFLKNISAEYFIIMAFQTEEGVASAELSPTCTSDLSSSCYVVKSDSSEQTMIVIEVKLTKLDVKPDWRDIMWKMRSSEAMEDANGLRVDPGCKPDVIYNAYRDVILSQEAPLPNSIKAGVTYCANGHYPIEGSDYAISVSDSRQEFLDFINFDRDSSKFKDVCFSTCCWTLLIVP